jgi:carbon starvation protein
MNAAVVALIVLLCFLLAYRFYSFFLAEKIFELSAEDRKSKTPAHTLKDDRDFSPTNVHILIGHHFSSIAGASPIVGPAIAVIWGWGPALLWVVLGVIFSGACHDFGALVVSMKYQGQSMGKVAEFLIGPRSRLLFLIIIFFLIWMVIAVFTLIIANLFISFPGAVLPVNFEIIVALVIGIFICHKNKNLLLPSILAQIALLGMILLGTLYPLSFKGDLLGNTPPHFEKTLQFQSQLNQKTFSPELLQFLTENQIPHSSGTQIEVVQQGSQWLLTENSQEYLCLLSKRQDQLSFYRAGRWWKHELMIWIFFLLIYGFFASVLPVWTLLQPRDFINAHQLVLGLILLILGLMVARPQIVAPFVNLHPAGAPPWFPFLFITIACGAISGFHGLVSGGTTSKQVAYWKDARPIAYGSMLGEGLLAVIATLAVASGFPNLEAWQVHYSSWGKANGLDAQISAFVLGAGSFISSLGIPESVSQIVIAVLIISFAATSLDTACRIQRYIIGELGESIGFRFLHNRYLASFLAVSTAFLLMMSTEGGKGGLRLWPLFGATNQMLAGLTLVVISVYLVQEKKNALPFLIPAFFIILITALALSLNIKNFYEDKKYFLVALGLLLFVSQIWILVEGILALQRKRKITS